MNIDIYLIKCYHYFNLFGGYYFFLFDYFCQVQFLCIQIPMSTIEFVHRNYGNLRKFSLIQQKKVGKTTYKKKSVEIFIIFLLLSNL